LVQEHQISFNREQHCPIVEGGPGSPAEKHSGISAAKGALADKVDVYGSLIDGGNTSGLVYAIDNSTGATLRDALLAESPYLSDQVIISYLGKSPTEPESYIREVIIANSPVTETVKTAVDALNLSTNVQADIDNAQTGLSDRFILEAEIAVMKFE